MKIRVLLVDDHPIFREGVRSLLKTESDIEVTDEASNGVEAIELFRRGAPDVVIMDIHMPNMSGIEAARMILKESPEARILMLSMESDRRFVVEAIESGAMGYLMKETCSHDIGDAIRKVFSGEIHLPPRITELIIKDYLKRIPVETPMTNTHLTPRERETLQMIANGKNTKEIAHHFTCSIKTIEVHRHNIMKKLNLYSIAELTKYAVRQGLSALE